MNSVDLELKVKKLRPNAIIPRYANPGDAGLDLFSPESFTLHPGQRYDVKTGISIELPEGYEAQIRPRSGLASMYEITVLNTPGTIDPGYRGEIIVILKNHGNAIYQAEIGYKIAQMVISKFETPRIVESKNLTDSIRGQGGLGSSGL